MTIHIPADFKGNAKRIEDIDLPRIGATIGVGEDEIHAVIDVETRGGGFDSENRPKMLFEPHIFHRELIAAYGQDSSQLRRAVREGLAYPNWGAKRYPRDSYPRLKRAMEICRRCALRSASWGLGQIMGFNASAAGYDSVDAMVADFLVDEDNHLEAMIRFIVTNDLDDELRRHDWAGFARGYNGKGYRRNRYDEKLAERFAWWQGKPDTPFRIDRREVDHNEAA